MIKRSRWLAAAAALVALAACTDQKSNALALPTGAGTGLYPQLVVSGKGPVDADLSLRQVPGGLSFGSYQGEVDYDPKVLTFQSADLPKGADGTVNLVTPGHIRFLATALDGTDGTKMLHIRFAASGQVTRDAFTVSFEEVTDAAQFADLTPQVQGAYLIFQRR